jgi:hypothetical protein
MRRGKHIRLNIRNGLSISESSIQPAPNTARTGQVRAAALTFGDSSPTADSASGGFVRHIPRLPVTPAVGRWHRGASKITKRSAEL